MIWLLLVACAPTEPSTLSLPIDAAREGPSTFVLGEHTITLAEATITLADLRLEAPAHDAPDATRRPALHPGHDPAGEVRGELLGTWTIDLLDAPLRLGDATLIAGRYGSARLRLTGSPTARLVGEVAHGDDDPLPFAFVVDLDDEVTGLPLDAVLDDTFTALRLGIEPAAMLSFVDWGTPDEDGDEQLTLADGTLANSVPFGLVSTTAWHLDPQEIP